LTELAGKDHAM